MRLIRCKRDLFNTYTATHMEAKLRCARYIFKPSNQRESEAQNKSGKLFIQIYSKRKCYFE